MDHFRCFVVCPSSVINFWNCFCAVFLWSQVVNPSTTICNSTLQLDDTGAASYITGATSPAPGDLIGDAVGAYPRSCPLHVSVRSGQTVNITLYSFGRDTGPWSSATGRQSTSAAAVRRQRFCPAHVFIGEGQRSQGAPLCPVGQQRTRHLYLSRGRVVTVHFSAQQRGTGDSTSMAARRLYFILKMQGKWCLLWHVSIFFMFSYITAAWGLLSTCIPLSAATVLWMKVHKAYVWPVKWKQSPHRLCIRLSNDQNAPISCLLYTRLPRSYIF